MINDRVPESAGSESLEDALDAAESARRCIRNHRPGYARDLAEEAFDHVVAETLIPAMIRDIERFAEHAPPADVEKLARKLLKATKLALESE